ncbi:hypothetical protein DTO027I6_9110 [Penicillium roqueforti]|uniref:uncharacterized protein n=1 Tax=Penicillium roqueforti TaxID=5082 RepID=UPI00190CA6B9|nr:uncharacterized protein LCP9604111_4076 [Penicillium roqueforti]KAF9249976.1 hypothetical protein LCP9604111_4076 [Penicillium roqueforti]KAI2681175.1 hypothetical protein LCP963914a_6685 [Penicillium roqueforti]KAI2715508.1 hypothetical protein CBS147318_6108 [Penicillium roqueforti]KAI3124065.1 hypothetical protein CBS147330_7130 [Penicillium roqueforti]KAI3145521.1 hypothetical protein CBS147326_471 [Penicillium roqueforti]
MESRIEDGQPDPLHIFSEFEDPTRHSLIQQIVQDDPGLAMIPQQNLYALWFSDISTLQEKANAQTKVAKKLRARDLRVLSNQYDVVGIWACEGQTTAASREEPQGSAPRLGLSERGRSSSPNTGSSSKPSTPEHENTVDLPSESANRDGYHCVVTKRGLPLIESAHIIPKKLNGARSLYLTQYECWAWLSAFWGDEKVDRLQSLLVSEGIMDTERLYNQITLDIQVQKYWDRAMCALRPIWVSEDQTEMQIAFHWLPLKESLPGLENTYRGEMVSVMENPYQDPKYRPRETPGNNNFIFHIETGVRIPSGYVFTVKTDNKYERPLPSMELLELRWHLARIACMRGRDEDGDGAYESDGGFSVRSGS